MEKKGDNLLPRITKYEIKFEKMHRKQVITKMLNFIFRINFEMNTKKKKTFQTKE